MPGGLKCVSEEGRIHHATPPNWWGWGYPHGSGNPGFLCSYQEASTAY